MKNLSPFHLAIPVADLQSCRKFYTETLGCEEGRSNEQWVDLNFFGHQLVIHQVPSFAIPNKQACNPVDGHSVPVPHFGVVLDWAQWTQLADKLKGIKTDFAIEPYTRFEGQAGEQATMFFLDPEGNALEFKAFRNVGQLFAH
ncbi:MAG: VOC family protein [Roseivirga sp.]|nr:VOC family protein [Roseivirga sp.]